MKEKKLAVIMSVYKGDKAVYVKQSLDSLLNQTYGDFDIYLQYDGTIPEDVDTIIKSVTDERLIVREREENKGLAFSLNELLRIVQDGKYEFVARMDADDISLSGRFEKQMDYLKNHPDVDMIGGAINEIDENANVRGKITKYPCEPAECRIFFAKRNPVAHPTVMFRRSFFEKAGWEYPTDYMRNEDTRLWHEGYKHGCVIANIPDVVLNFRMTDSMFKQRRNGKVFAKSQLLLRKQIKKDLGYGVMADVYAYATYILMISPSWILRFAYRVLR